MPNVKIFVDDSLYPAIRAPLAQALGPIRDMLCRELAVDVPACQFAVLPVGAMPDLPRVNVEMAILPRPERTREVILSVCGQMRKWWKTPPAPMSRCASPRWTPKPISP
jgi:hypothetical protein